MTLETIGTDVLAAWHRHGAREAADVLMLEAAGDAATAHRLLDGIDTLPHVREGVRGYLPFLPTAV